MSDARMVEAAARAIADKMAESWFEPPSPLLLIEEGVAEAAVDAVRPLVVREEHDRLRDRFKVLNVYKSRDGLRMVSEAKVLALLGESTQEQAGGTCTCESEKASLEMNVDRIDIPVSAYQRIVAACPVHGGAGQ